MNIGGKITWSTKSTPVLEEVDASPVGESGAPGRQSLFNRKGLGGQNQSFHRLIPRIRPGRTRPLDCRLRRMLEGQHRGIGPAGATGKADLLPDSMEPMGQRHSDRAVADDLPTGICLRLLHDREP